MSAKIFSRHGDIADNTASGQCGGGLVRRVRDLKKPGPGFNCIARHVCVVKKNRRAEDHHRIVIGQLICKWLLGGQQTSAKQPVRSREGPTRRDRLLINIGIEVLGECDDVVPSPVFFNLRTGDDGRVAAQIERTNHFVQRRGIRQHSVIYFASRDRPAFVSPVVHRNREEHRSHGRLHRKVITSRNCRRNVLCAKWLVRPFHIGFNYLHGPAHQERFRQHVAAILLPRGHYERSVAVKSIDQCGESVAGAGDGMQIYKRGVSPAHRVTECYAGRRTFMQRQHILKIGWEITQKRQFRRPRVPKDDGHSQVAQELICDFSYCAHAVATVTSQFDGQRIRDAEVISLHLKAESNVPRDSTVELIFRRMVSSLTLTIRRVEISIEKTGVESVWL